MCAGAGGDNVGVMVITVQRPRIRIPPARPLARGRPGADRPPRSAGQGFGLPPDRVDGTVEAMLSTRLLATLLLVLVAVPATAFGGGDDPPEHAPASSPPGPWAGADAGGSYSPSGTSRCRMRDRRVLGLYVRRAPCRAGRRLVETYQRCVARRCYQRVQRRCVQPEFLGGCRTHDRFYRRRVDGYRCVERRAGIGSASSTTRTSPARAATAGSTTATRCFTSERGRGRHARWSCAAAWANPRVRAITRHARHRPARVPHRRPDPRVERARSCSTATATRCARAASRSGCCARTAPATSSCATSRSPAAAATAPAAR